MISLYKDKDIEVINEKVKDIVKTINDFKDKNYEPTIEEFKEVMNTIRDFIKSKKRIVYGGTAYNDLLKNKNPELAIYNENNKKDIEFYSYTPLEDVVELCNLLHSKGYKYVQGKQAFHDSTYSIFVNFENICDLSYMPKNIYENMPVQELDKMIYSHPKWILVDILRQFNDPINSYWRLEDKLVRSFKLLKAFPLELYNKNKYLKDKNSEEGIKLFNKIRKMETLIFLGSVATSYYINRNCDLDISLLEVITDNFVEDIKIIYEYIKEIYPENKISYTSFTPFFQFRDKYVEFKSDNRAILRIFGHNSLCNPYNIFTFENENSLKIKTIDVNVDYFKLKKRENSIKVATFILNFNFILIKSHHAYINRRDVYKKFENILYILLKSRNDYLEKNNKTILDKTPYKEFNIICKGKTISSIREFRMKLIENFRKNKTTGLFSYDPELPSNREKVNTKKNFDNTSGNENKKIITKIIETD